MIAKKFTVMEIQCSLDYLRQLGPIAPCITKYLLRNTILSLSCYCYIPLWTFLWSHKEFILQYIKRSLQNYANIVLCVKVLPQMMELHIVKSLLCCIETVVFVHDF
jgi:hypothetical protein